MKIINIRYIAVLSALTFFSCEDFLKEDNESNVTAEEFYVTEEGYESLINANYAQLKEIYGQDPWLFMCGTDLYAEGRESEPQGLAKYTLLNASAEGVDFLYTQCFVAIQYANLALYYAGITEETSTLARRVGEMKFMRANAYFLLVQTYGGVSVINEPISEAVTSFERNTAEEVYDFIISDLEDALNAVPDETYDGHVNQRAIRHLLAQVYLTRAYEDFGASSDFSTAAGLADDVIDGQTLNLSFDELWEPGNEMNEEILFSVQYSKSAISINPTGLGHQQQNWSGSYLGGAEVAGDAPYKSYNLLATHFTIGLFTEEDERWEGTFMTEIYDRYYDYFDVADHSTLTVAHFYEPSWYDAADSTAYVAAHPDATYHSYGSYDPDGGDISLDYNMIVVKKFDDPTSTYATGDRRVSSRDFIVFRLADTYLLAAEAYLGAGDATTGLARLNEVRARAGVADATSADFDLDYILDERGRELLGEYKRWFDLKRTGKLVERASAHNPFIDEANFDGNNGEQKILRPIPQSALDLNQNDGFSQNPAYD